MHRRCIFGTLIGANRHSLTLTGNGSSQRGMELPDSIEIAVVTIVRMATLE